MAVAINPQNPEFKQFVRPPRYEEPLALNNPKGFAGRMLGQPSAQALHQDRHAGNLLVKHGKESYAVDSAELVPIDHGLCLQKSLDDPYFEWLHWPQASIPFSESEMEYICGLDPFKDADLLRSELPSIRNHLRVRSIAPFLKQAATLGLCLAQIEMMLENVEDRKNGSALEKICFSAKV
ncbi:hypothetical protein HAX54_049157 [Datura stramonium]|uniref:1-phosphatidylinositol 4-kinase n=1 Tax=Datura stramonium TaxID=4076 RepID=A0ABS8WPZ1_DATST|nr:hypothetical protein [Datura stramonium]